MSNSIRFTQERLEGVERGQSYAVEVAFIKVPPGRSGLARGNIELVHGTTSELIGCLNLAAVVIDNFVLYS